MSSARVIRRRRKEPVVIQENDSDTLSRKIISTNLDNDRQEAIKNESDEQVKLKNYNLNDRKKSSVSRDIVNASMEDYIRDLVGRNLVSDEVAEALVLKHHLLVQSDRYKRDTNISDELDIVKLERGNLSQQCSELLKKNILLESENSTLHSEILRMNEEALQFSKTTEELSQVNERLNLENKELREIQSAFEWEKKTFLRKISDAEKIYKKREDGFLSQVSSLRDNLTAVKAQNHDRKSRLAQFKEAMDDSNAMTKEVYVWIGELQREFLRTTYELNQAKLRLEKTKKHLSYRLGGVLVENSSSFMGLLSIPGKLLAQKREFANERKGQQPHTASTGTYVAIHGGLNYMYARTRWGGLTSEIAGNGASVELSLLTPSANKEVSLEIYCPTSGAVFLQSLDGSSQIAVGEEPITLNMLSDGSVRVLHFAPQKGKVLFFLRRSAGISSIARINVRPLTQKVASIIPTQLVDVDPLNSENIKSIETISLSGNFIEPKPMKSAIIWQAYQIMQEGKSIEAIVYAKKYARDFVKPAVNLLVATKEKNNEELWLSSVNSYLSQFNITPVTLRPGLEDRFLRITCQPSKRYESGPLISVIMPAFNASKTIRHSIQSILSQTWRNLELFVIDDASEDDTWSIVEELAKTDTRIRAFRNVKNVGPYVSKNLALQLCKGIYITGHDADDWAHPDRLAGQVTELLNSNGYLKGNMARMIRMQSDGAFVHYAKEGKTSDDGVLRDAAISCMFEREYFNKHLGYWDCVRFGADSELISRAQKIMQDRFVKVRHMTMICLDNEGSLTNDPVHGVSKVTGISPTRKFYRDQWTTWHATIDPADAVLPFPYYKDRKFLVPEAASVLTSDIMENIRSMQ